MRFRNFVLGGLTILLTLLCLSSRVAPGEADYGLNPGERFPRGEMKGFDFSPSGDESAIIVTWSIDDAISRATNAWLTRHVADGVRVLSICLDDDETDAQLYAKVDNLADDTEVLATSQLGRYLRHQLTRRGPQVYRISAGLITEVERPEVLWSSLETAL